MEWLSQKEKILERTPTVRHLWVTTICCSNELKISEMDWKREEENETTEGRGRIMGHENCTLCLCESVRVCSGSLLYNNEMLLGLWPWECVQERNINRCLTLKPNKDRWKVHCERQSNLDTVIALTHTLHQPLLVLSVSYILLPLRFLFSCVHLSACAGVVI